MTIPLSTIRRDGFPEVMVDDLARRLEHCIGGPGLDEEAIRLGQLTGPGQQLVANRSLSSGGSDSL